jgi:hypothetical protein
VDFNVARADAKEGPSRQSNAKRQAIRNRNWDPQQEQRQRRRDRQAAEAAAAAERSNARLTQEVSRLETKLAASSKTMFISRLIDYLKKPLATTNIPTPAHLDFKVHIPTNRHNSRSVMLTSMKMYGKYVVFPLVATTMVWHNVLRAESIIFIIVLSGLHQEIEIKHATS